MHSFDCFKLAGANIARFLPIPGDAAGIVGAYRKYAEPHRKYEAPPLGIGQTPLFLLDGQPAEQALRRAAKKLGLVVFAAVYRPYSVEIRKRYEESYKRVRGYALQKDGTTAEWVKDCIRRYETTDDDFVRNSLAELLCSFFDYERARDEYNAAVTASPVDAITGETIIGDLNEYLYRRSGEMYPLGVESVLEANVKQSAIPKPQYFRDGLEGAPAPKGVRRIDEDGAQLNLFSTGHAAIDDTIEEVQRFFCEQIAQNGAVRLRDIIGHCASIGLYRGNVALYVMGAACRGLMQENLVFFDGVAHWQYREVRDISGWILRVYEKTLRKRESEMKEAALFYDDVGLKERIADIFGLEPARSEKRFNTLGFVLVQSGAWIVNNLRYPIAFLDETLFRLFQSRVLYGESLHQYSDYFTEERCGWIKRRIPHSDAIARQLIQNAVGFDPDTAEHGMSNLPKGHYAPLLYSAADYLHEMQRRPMWK